MEIDVFISYHTKSSKTIADAVVHRLEDMGVRCWYAPRDVEGNYAGSIVRAIEKCKIFVLILSKAASESEDVQNEIDVAFKTKGITIMPFHVADAISDISPDVRYYLGRCHWIDGITPNMNDRINDLGERVLKTLGRNPGDSFKTNQNDAYSSVFESKKDDVEESNLDSDDSQKGTSKYTYSDGSVYEGQWKNGAPNGKGKMTWTSGNVYIGNFVDGKLHGKGKMMWKGVYYEGDWVNGERTGKGKLVWDDGGYYDGDWVNSKKNGKGKMTWAGGTYYIGDFFNDKRTGKGKIVWPDGGVYEGEFVNDTIHGYGKMKYADGSIYEGKWENGKFVG